MDQIEATACKDCGTGGETGYKTVRDGVYNGEDTTTNDYGVDVFRDLDPCTAPDGPLNICPTQPTVQFEGTISNGCIVCPLGWPVTFSQNTFCGSNALYYR